MNKLKALRQAAGMTQEELAKRAGTSKAYISDLERCVRRFERIRVDTAQRICAVLGVAPDEIYNTAEPELEYEDGKLIVDGWYYDPRFGFVAEIHGSLFLADVREPGAVKLKPMHCGLAETATEPPEYNMFFNGIIPRDGYHVSIGRAATDAEIKSICDRYEIGEDDISGEFVDVAGAAYGDKYKKTYTSIQVMVVGGNAIKLEMELISNGIQAGNVAPGRVNIRVK